MWDLTRSEAHCTLLEWKESIYRQLLEETEELLQQVSDVGQVTMSSAGWKELTMHGGLG